MIPLSPSLVIGSLFARRTTLVVKSFLVGLHGVGGQHVNQNS